MLDALPLPTVAPAPSRPHSTALQQSALWADATGGQVEHLLGRRVVLHRATLPVFGSLALISRAELGLTATQARALRETVNARHLAINAETLADGQALARAGYHPIAAPRQVAELSLAPSTAQMSARLDGKWRNRLRHSQSQGLIIRRRPMPPDVRHWLFKKDRAQARALRFRPLPAEVVVAMLALHPGAGQIFTAYHLGQKVAAMLFLRHGRSATYQIGWTSAEGRALSAGTACLWRAMVELSQMGVEHIDLGAADPKSAPGLTRFKLGTGASLRSLGGTWADSAWVPRRWSWRRCLHLGA